MAEEIVTLDVGGAPRLVETGDEYQPYRLEGLKLQLYNGEFDALDYNASVPYEENRAEKTHIFRITDNALAALKESDVTHFIYDAHEGGRYVLFNTSRSTDFSDVGVVAPDISSMYQSDNASEEKGGIQFGDNGPIVSWAMALQKLGSFRIEDAALFAQLEQKAGSKRPLPEGKSFSPEVSYLNYAEPKSVDVHLFSTDVLDLDKSQREVNVTFGHPNTGEAKQGSAFIRSSHVETLNTSGVINGEVTIEMDGISKLNLNHKGNTHLIYDAFYRNEISGTNHPASITLSNKALYNQLNLRDGLEAAKQQSLRVELQGNELVAIIQSGSENEPYEVLRISALDLEKVKLGEPSMTITRDQLRNGAVEINLLDALTNPKQEANRLGLPYEDAALDRSRFNLPLKTSIQFAEADNGTDKVAASIQVEPKAISLG